MLCFWTERQCLLLQVILITWNAVLWTGIVLFLQNRAGNSEVWASWEPASSTKWCESPAQAGFVLEPVNAWSNLGYWFWGHVLFIFALLDKRLQLEETNVSPNWLLTFALGISSCLHGAASFFFHSCRCEIGSIFDVSLMLALAFWFVLYHILPHEENPLFWCSVYTTTSISIMYWRLSPFYNEFLRDFLTSLFFLVGLSAVLYRVRKWTKGFWICLSLYAIVGLAAIAHRLDAHGKCFKNWNKHAIWHILTAIAVFMGWLLLRSCREKSFPFRSWGAYLCLGHHLLPT